MLRQSIVGLLLTNFNLIVDDVRGKRLLYVAVFLFVLFSQNTLKFFDDIIQVLIR